LIDEVRKILHHAANQLAAAALGETEHGEVRVPVINLAKAPAGTDVGPGEREK
jgi:hypothetical protein